MPHSKLQTWIGALENISQPGSDKIILECFKILRDEIINLAGATLILQKQITDHQKEHDNDRV